VKFKFKIEKEYVLVAVPADVVPTGALDACEGWELATLEMLEQAVAQQLPKIPLKAKREKKIKKAKKIAKRVEKFASYPVTPDGVLEALTDIKNSVPDFAGCSAKEIAQQMGHQTARGAITTCIKLLEVEKKIYKKGKWYGQAVWALTEKKGKKGK
jgi:hypothetical protein